MLTSIFNYYLFLLFSLAEKLLGVKLSLSHAQSGEQFHKMLFAESRLLHISIYKRSAQLRKDKSLQLLKRVWLSLLDLYSLNIYFSGSRHFLFKMIVLFQCKLNKLSRGLFYFKLFHLILSSAMQGVRLHLLFNNVLHNSIELKIWEKENPSPAFKIKYRNVEKKCLDEAMTMSSQKTLNKKTFIIWWRVHVLWCSFIN